MGARVRWLGSWWFLASVAVLMVNDHVLKDRYSSWWTGKLSDVAGLAVVATIAAVLLGRRPGLATAGMCFVALKAAAGVAELVAPVLGGPTRRDLTDLVALVVLPLLWAGLARVDPGSASSPTRQRDEPSRWSAGLAAGLPILGACAAVLATTATSCGPDPAVLRVVGADDLVWAQVTGRYAASDPTDDEWYSSADSGDTWRQGTPPTSVVAAARPDESPRSPTTGGTASRTEPAQTGALEPTCTKEVCYRIVDRRRIERRAAESDTWKVEFGLDDDGFYDISTGCTNPQQGVLTSVAAVADPDGGGAVASLGAEGVVSRGADGTWTSRNVAAPRPDRVWQLMQIGGVVLVVALGGATLIVFLVRRSRRRPPWPDGGLPAQLP